MWGLRGRRERRSRARRALWSGRARVCAPAGAAACRPGRSALHARHGGSDGRAARCGAGGAWHRGEIRAGQTFSTLAWMPPAITHTGRPRARSECGAGCCDARASELAPAADTCSACPVVGGTIPRMHVGAQVRTANDVGCRRCHSEVAALLVGPGVRQRVRGFRSAGGPRLIAVAAPRRRVEALHEFEHLAHGSSLHEASQVGCSLQRKAMHRRAILCARLVGDSRRGPQRRQLRASADAARERGRGTVYSSTPSGAASVCGSRNMAGSFSRPIADSGPVRVRRGACGFCSHTPGSRCSEQSADP